MGEMSRKAAGDTLDPKRSEHAAKAALKHHQANHSPLEGEK